MEKRPITKMDVADRAGVSHSTVSYVLNSNPHKSISEATRQRVLQAAQDLRYRSNRLSKGVRRGKTEMIGVITPPLLHSYYSGILQGVLEQCTSYELQPLVVIAHHDIEVEARQIQRFLEYRVEGIVCIAYDWQNSRMDHWLEETLDKNIPCVIIDDRFHAEHVDCVVSDDVMGGQVAVTHLLQQGHRRIGHLCGGLSTGFDRRKGYSEALQAAGIPVDPELIAGEGYDPAAAASNLSLLLALPEPPTAVFAANDTMAEAAVQQAQRLGVRVPEDLAVVGYGDLEITRSRDLSTVTQHPHEMGNVAAAQIRARIQGLALPPQLTVTPTELIVGRTSDMHRS